MPFVYAENPVEKTDFPRHWNQTYENWQPAPPTRLAVAPSILRPGNETSYLVCSSHVEHETDQTFSGLWATLTWSLLWHPKIQIHFAAHRWQLQYVFPTNTCIAYPVFLPKMCSLGHLQCWHHLYLLIRSQLHLFALSEHPRQSSSTTNSAELQKAWQWRQPQVASSTALWWMIKLNWYPPWNWHNTWK